MNKKLVVLFALLVGLSTIGYAANVTDTGPGQAGDVLYYTGPAGNDQGTWSSLPNLVQTIINNNTIVPATVGTSLNSGAVSTVGNVDITGTGITQTVTGSGATGTSSYNFSNLQTNQSVANATAITGIQNMTDNSTLTQTVQSLQSTSNSNTTAINNNSTAITNIQNLSDNSLLTQTVNNHTAQIGQNTAGIASINNMSDPSTVLNQTVNGNTTAIANETTRATSAETVLSNGLSNEAATRAAADTNLQNQINNLNTQAQDNTNRIDRLEETKYLLEPTVRLYDSKHFQVQAFDSYDVRHGSNFAAGMRVMFKLGSSYEEKLLKKTNPEIAHLLAANVSNDIAERNAIRQQLAEDKALIAKQADLLAKLSSQTTVLDVPVVSNGHVLKAASTGNDDDLLKAMDDRSQEFASK